MVKERQICQFEIGGADQIRTDDSLRARQVLFQLSYGPANWKQVPLKIKYSEYMTKNKSKNFRLKTYFVRSIDFKPIWRLARPSSRSFMIRINLTENSELLLRKEVIQPQVPLRLPCYDLVPITSLTLGCCLLAVSSHTLGKTGFHDLTGGVYKARERIHGAIADTPLLAIPTSWSRVADSNLNWA